MRQNTTDPIITGPIMTGPMGRIAYLGAGTTAPRPYPALNLPSTQFARGRQMLAANRMHAPLAQRCAWSFPAIVLFGERDPRNAGSLAR